MQNTQFFTVQCPAFVENGPIPKMFTPHAEDFNPEIRIIGNLPQGTKSLALAVNDPDAPVGLWSHWLVKKIPVTSLVIPQNSVPGEEVTNSWKIKKYKGPKPPSGTHRYYFIVYALNVDDFQANDPNKFYEQVNKYKLYEASYMGTFSK